MVLKSPEIPRRRRKIAWGGAEWRGIMKIKCRKCGKRFDQDIYSGICPKCGVYNGFCEGGSDISQYLSSSYSGEEAHRQLHEDYGDKGHDGSAHRKLHDTYDRGYETAHPVYEGQKDTKKQSGELASEPVGRKKNGFTAVKLLCFLLVLAPVVTAFSYQAMKKETLQERLGAEIAQIPAGDGNTLVFDRAPFAYPVTVSVLGQEQEELEEFSEWGKVLLVIKASAVSEGYSGDARIENIFLKYRYEGRECYLKPMDFYSMSEMNAWPFGMANSELLPTVPYGFGNGEKEEGYWFFGIPKGAQNAELLLEAAQGEGIVFLQGTISLENVPEMSVLAKEEEE